MPKPPRVYKTPAIVLRQRKLGDADKIITLYSAEFGKIEAVAKGVRRVTSRLAGHVEPLNHGAFMFAHGRNLDIITQVQTIETFQPLRDDLERLSRAFYVAELTDRATEEREQNFAVYRLLLDALRRLCQDGQLDVVLRLFEMSLLVQLGYQPELDACVVCRGALGEEGNNWSAALGGVICPNCRPPEVTLWALSQGALRVLRLLQQGSYSAVSRVQIDPRLAQELERHLRDTIHHTLDRDVRSAGFLEDVRRTRRKPSAAAGPR